MVELVHLLAGCGTLLNSCSGVSEAFALIFIELSLVEGADSNRHLDGGVIFVSHDKAREPLGQRAICSQQFGGWDDSLPFLGCAFAKS